MLSANLDFSTGNDQPSEAVLTIPYGFTGGSCLILFVWCV